MERTVGYVLIGYLLGSILFAEVVSGILGKKDRLRQSRDGNPGTANAFLYGGFCCGVLTLCGDLLKGALPVAAYLAHREAGRGGAISLALVLAAPVVGHVYSVFRGFHGGKGIAVSFGVLLGLAPIWKPVLTLAFFFLFYSLVVRVCPHYFRTIVTYISTLLAFRLLAFDSGILLGFAMITVAVLSRMLRSKEKRERMRVRLLWKR